MNKALNVATSAMIQAANNCHPLESPEAAVASLDKVFIALMSSDSAMDCGLLTGYSGPLRSFYFIRGRGTQ